MALSGAILVNAYVQVNTVRGYRFFDEQGKIATHWADELPNVRLDRQGLLMANPDAKLTEVRVNHQRIWLHFVQPDTLTYIFDHSWRVIDATVQIMELTSFGRFGVRLEYLVPATEPVSHFLHARRRIFSSDIEHAIESSASGQRTSFLAAVQWQTTNNLLVNLQVYPVERVQKPDQPDRLPAHGLMIDPDIYREGDLSLADFRRFTRDAQHWIRDTLPATAQSFVPVE